MIQRIQTIYLLLSLIFISLLYFFPIWTPKEGDLFDIAFFFTNGSVNIIVAAFCAIMIVAHLVCIFLYKKRKGQLRMGSAAILLNVAFLVYILILASSEKNLLNALTDFRPGILFPFLSIAFLVLANKNIKKDEELVRSMHRLR